MNESSEAGFSPVVADGQRPANWHKGGTRKMERREGDVVTVTEVVNGPDGKVLVGERPYMAEHDWGGRAWGDGSPMKGDQYSVLQQEQTIMKPPDGNCFAACMATILGIRVEEVPNPWDVNNWVGAWNDWLDQYGLAMVMNELPQHNFNSTMSVGGDGVAGLGRVRAPRKSVWCGCSYRQNAEGGMVVPSLRSWYRDEGAGEEWVQMRAAYMPGLTILGAMSGSNPQEMHAVVCLNGQVLFDPSPGRSDGLGEWKDVTLLVSKNPCAMVREAIGATLR